MKLTDDQRKFLDHHEFLHRVYSGRNPALTEYITLRGKTVTDCIVQPDTVVITFSDGSYVTITTSDKLKLIQYKSFMETLNG